MLDLFQLTLLLWAVVKRVFNNDYTGILNVYLKDGTKLTLNISGTKHDTIPDVDHYEYQISSPAGVVSDVGSSPSEAFFKALTKAGK